MTKNDIENLKYFMLMIFKELLNIIFTSQYYFLKKNNHSIERFFNLQIGSNYFFDKIINNKPILNQLNKKN